MFCLLTDNVAPLIDLVERSLTLSVFSKPGVKVQLDEQRCSFISQRGLLQTLGPT